MTQLKRCKIEFCPNPLAIQVHTSFDIKQNSSLQIIIEHIEGVEPIMAWGIYRYSFIVTIGEMFDRDEVAKIIEEKVNEFAS